MSEWAFPTLASQKPDLLTCPAMPNSNPGFVPYDANAHGLVHPPDWTISPGEGEIPEEVDVMKHLPTGLEFFLTSDFDDNGKFSIGVECLNPPEDVSELTRRAQEAIRYYCSRNKTTPEAEQLKAEEWRKNL
jgi:hypothetical protein